MNEAALAGVFGLLIGSFLNVCVYRMPRNLSVVRPARSFCPSCQRTIAWYDNIPLISFLLLRARCRHCDAAIPVRYPVVEAATGALFFAIFLLWGPGLEAVKYCLFAAIQVALIAMDLEERILADEFTLGGILAGMVFAVAAPLPFGIVGMVTPPEWSPTAVSLVESAFGAGALGGVLWLVGALYQKVRGRVGLGFGDVKMVAMIGAFLGLSPALLAVVVGSVLGSVLGLLFILFKRKSASTYELPYGSFLGFAALIVLFYSKYSGEL